MLAQGLITGENFSVVRHLHLLVACSSSGRMPTYQEMRAGITAQPSSCIVYTPARHLKPWNAVAVVLAV
jgi:hypothetical protein